MTVKAMALAAGKGTRLFPLTGEVPKPMAPVVDTPIIEHIFSLLASHDIEEVHVNVHYLADTLLESYGDDYHVNGMSVHLSREEELLGTAGGVKRLAHNFDDTFVIVSGDALTDIDIGELVAFHKEKGALATIALRRVERTSEFGVVEIDAERNIRSFQEKPAPGEEISDLANTGIYVLEPEVLDYIPKNAFFDFARDLFPRLLKAGEKFVGYVDGFYWSDIGTLSAYKQAHRDVLSGKVEVKVPGERWGKDLWVGRNARLHPTAVLGGRTVLGQDAIVGREVVFAGDVTVGSDCWIRHGATVKQSILLPGASVGEGAYLEDCIVGPGYYVRPGERVRSTTLISRRSRVSSRNDRPIDTKICQVADVSNAANF